MRWTLEHVERLAGPTSHDQTDRRLQIRAEDLGLLGYNSEHRVFLMTDRARALPSSASVHASVQVEYPRRAALFDAGLDAGPNAGPDAGPEDEA